MALLINCSEIEDGDRAGCDGDTREKSARRLFAAKLGPRTRGMFSLQTRPVIPVL